MAALDLNGSHFALCGNGLVLNRARGAERLVKWGQEEEMTPERTEREELWRDLRTPPPERATRVGERRRRRVGARLPIPALLALINGAGTASDNRQISCQEPFVTAERAETTPWVAGSGGAAGSGASTPALAAGELSSLRPPVR